MTELTPISIEALQQGDRDAFAQLVELYSPRIYRLALRMLNNPQEAEDVLQETFLNVFRGVKKFEGRSSLSTWLYRIAANQALMRLRKKTLPTISVDEPIINSDGDHLPRQLLDWCCLPEKEFMTSEAQAQLDAAVETLSLTLRSVFVLRDLHGLSTRETGMVLGISEAAVKTRLLRARLELRERLSVYFNERAREINHDKA